MSLEQSIRSKQLQVLIALCCISLSNQTFAGHLMAKNNYYRKPLQVVYEHGQFFIVPTESLTNAIVVNKDSSAPLKAVKVKTVSAVKHTDTNNLKKGHIYLSINISNKEKS